MNDAMEEIKANITMNTDTVARKREEDKEDKAKDPMTRRETINILKRDTKDTHVLGLSLFVFLPSVDNYYFVTFSQNFIVRL